MLQKINQKYDKTEVDTRNTHQYLLIHMSEYISVAATVSSHFTWHMQCQCVYGGDDLYHMNKILFE